MPNDERANCSHHEMIEEFHEYALGTCIYCGQVRRYDRLDIRKPPTIIKAGRLNGVITSIIPEKIEESVTVEQSKSVKSGEPAVEAHTEEENSTPVPQTRKYRTRTTTKFFIKKLEQNKEQIIKDYYNLTIMDFFKKWGLSSSRWMQTRTQWDVKPKIKRGNITEVKSNENHTLLTDYNLNISPNNNMPAFPEFDGTWPMATQVAWIEAYKDIYLTVRSIP